MWKAKYLTPPLRNPDNTLAKSFLEKANLFASKLENRFTPHPDIVNVLQFSTQKIKYHILIWLMGEGVLIKLYTECTLKLFMYMTRVLNLFYSSVSQQMLLFIFFYKFISIEDHLLDNTFFYGTNKWLNVKICTHII
jgi:hypothetical protein